MSGIVWKNQRYQLIRQYSTVFAPPLNFIIFVIVLPYYCLRNSYHLCVELKRNQCFKNRKSLINNNDEIEACDDEKIHENETQKTNYRVDMV